MRRSARHPAGLGAFGRGGRPKQSSATDHNHTPRTTLILATTSKRGNLSLTIAVNYQSADDSTMNNPIAHRKDPLPEASEWVHSGASPNEHQSHARSLWPPSTTYLGDPYRTLTLLSSGGLRASDLLGRPIGRHPITSDLRLLPTHYRRANLSLYPWTSRQSYAHHIQRSHANTARGVCRRRQYFHCCDRWRRTYVMYGEWRAMGLRARKAFGWGYVSGIKSRSGRHRTNTFYSARRGVSRMCWECPFD